MLTFRQLDDLPCAVLEIIGEAEQSIINDMARRIARLGRVTDSTLYQMERLRAVVAVHDNVVQEMAKALGKTEAELIRLFDEAVTRSLYYDDDIYRAAGFSPTPLLKDSVSSMKGARYWQGDASTSLTSLKRRGTMRSIPSTMSPPPP